jgi:arylsulfatase A-like enzyme
MPYFRARSTGMFVEEALRFIRAHAGQPFYLNLWTLVPHSKLRPTPEELAEYEGLVVDPDRFPGYMASYARGAPDLQSRAATYFAAITGLDKALGRLLDGLDEMGLAETTLILFASDNGPADYRVERDACMGSPGPHRARKLSTYEGGIRTPCIARWPYHVPADRVDHLSVISALDLLPTLASLAGVKYDHVKPDGQDASGILLGRSQEREAPLFWDWRHPVVGDPVYEPPQLAVRDGHWKLLMDHDGGNAQLYNVVLDPGERRNLSAQRPGLVQQLGTTLLEWYGTLPQDPIDQGRNLSLDPEV